MEKNAKFWIDGAPQGKGRPRFTKNGQPYTPERTSTYEEIVQLEYMRQCKGIFFERDEPIKICVVAYHPIPKSASKAQRQLMLEGKLFPTKKPDWDNIGKIIADSLNGVAYQDDKQIVVGLVLKRYAEEPHVEVLVSNDIDL